MKRFWIGLGIGVFALTAVACTSETVVEDGGSGASQKTNDDTVGDSKKTGSTTSTGSGSTSSGGGGDQCGPGSINSSDACEVCVATKCTAEALACCQQTGCLDIVFCAQETGCDGIACYSPDTCQEVIDNAGGPGVALNFAQPLGDCAIESCSAECAID